MPTLKYRDPADGEFKPLIGGSGGGGTTVDGLPLGAILPYPSATPPADWLLCDGAAIPAQYTDLIALVGANTPNLLGKFVAGAGGTYAVGTEGGMDSVTLAESEMPAHTHGVQQKFGAATMDHMGWDGWVAQGGAGSDTSPLNTLTAGSGIAHENRPPFYALAYIIKAKRADVVATPGDYATKAYVDGHVITGVTVTTADVASGWAWLGSLPPGYRLVSAQTVITTDGNDVAYISFSPAWPDAMFGLPGGQPRTVRWVAMLEA